MMQSQQEQQISIRRRNLRAVRNINEAVSSPLHPEGAHVNPDVFARLPIQVSSMPFYTDTAVDFGLRFSRPMSEAQFELDFGALVSPFDQYNNVHWEPYATATVNSGGDDPTCSGYFRDISRALGWCVPKRSCSPGAKLDSNNSGSMQDLYGWTPARMMFGRRPSRTYQMSGNERFPTWWTFTVQDLIGGMMHYVVDDYANCLPHMACWLYHSAPLDDRILRSELVCITSIMKERMKRSSWKAHCVFPVFCYTLNGPQVRVTQAHFDGHHLQLRRTEPVDFIPPNGDCSAVKMLLRWIAAEPIGNTKWINQQDNLDDMNLTQPPPPSLSQEISTKA